ncbi:hypothetical protein [Haliea sp.]|uniref:hypothetical protein n=1 Tax=Haliea sp. TaxID=1932666 RepID=UPI0035288C9C
MDVVETEWWTMALAPEWWADVEEDGTVLVADEDDVGCLEMTTLHKTDGQLTPAELKQIAVTESPSVPAWKAVNCGDFRGFTASFSEAEAAVREWYLASGGLLLFVSYSCDLDNRGMDDAAVDALLDTLARSAPASA